MYVTRRVTMPVSDQPRTFYKTGALKIDANIPATHAARITADFKRAAGIGTVFIVKAASGSCVEPDTG